MNPHPSQVPSGPLTEATHLLGTWVGHGEALVQGTLHSFTQTETVTAHLDGELLTIEGVGHGPEDATRRTPGVRLAIRRVARARCVSPSAIRQDAVRRRPVVTIR